MLIKSGLKCFFQLRRTLSLDFKVFWNTSFMYEEQNAF